MRLLAVLLLVTSTACQDPLCENDLSCDGKDEVCNPQRRRCEPRPLTSPSTCTGDTTCGQGRACVNGVCRYAPSCLALGGNWDVWRGSPTLGGEHLGEDSFYDLPACGFGGGDTVLAPFSLLGEKDRLGSVDNLFLSDLSGSNFDCAGEWNGDDTMRVDCADAGVLFLYAVPENTDGLAPRACHNGCTCETNSIGVPVCAP